MRVAIAGGTGVVGRYTERALIAAGHEAVVLARSRGIDLRTDDGLADWLEGVEAIVDATNGDSMTKNSASAFFTGVTTRLQTIGAAQGVARLVTLSIVGIDRVTGFGYYEAKLAQEAAAERGPLPVTIVRATQFHEFASQILARSRLGPMAAVPVMRVQPVAARRVGEFLAQSAVVPPVEATVEIAGPKIERLTDMARRFLAVKAQRCAVLPLWVPGAAGRAMRSGQLLASGSTTIVGPDFETWLNGSDPLEL